MFGFFIFRLNWHASVSAQWLLLFTLYLGLTKKIDESKSLWFFLITLSSLILYNFTIIVVAVYSGLRILNIKFKKEKFYELFKDFFLISIFLTLLLYAVGYFEIRALDTLAVGFGHYKLNLLSFFDPVNTANNLSWSWFLPDIKLSKAEELEGFNYLGIGYILMYLFSLIIFFKKSNKENLISIKKKRNTKNKKKKGGKKTYMDKKVCPECQGTMTQKERKIYSIDCSQDQIIFRNEFCF